ncbi:MAG: PAC2 family protein [Candidatus Lokiarchaeota archaeon]|nr:PAC2 family protein [Candidatus Lokiarchaeota archaeon]
MEIKIDQKFEIDAEELHDPVVLVGWPGIALVAKLAITSIKDSIKAEEFLDIICYDFPPKSNVENGKLEIPSAKIYFKPKYEKTNNDFFILTANYQPQTSYGVFEFSQRICEEMDKITKGKIKMYLSTGAMVSDKVREIPTVYACGTDSDLIDSFLKFDNTKLMETGVIAGANGILPAWAGHNNFAPGICLLAETLPLPMMTIDPRSSKALVTLLKDYFKIDMNFDELNKKIEEMEDVVDKYKKQAEHFMKTIEDDKSGDSYYR